MHEVHDSDTKAEVVPTVGAPEDHQGRVSSATALGAFALCAFFYSWEYAIRSAPSVMTGELGSAWGLSTLGIGTVIGLYYYTYSPLALIAGASVDHFGAKKTVPLGVVLVSTGCFMFMSGSPFVAGIGRLLQGGGSTFAFIGCVFVATRYLPPKHLALLIGLAQMCGLAGGWAGQRLSHFALHTGQWPWTQIWLLAGLVGVTMACVLAILLPKETVRANKQARSSRWTKEAVHGFREVLSNPNTIMISIVAALLFAPTTIGNMIWGAALLREGLGLDSDQAASVAALVPLGWVVGCPLFGFVSDRLGRRKPVLIVGSAGICGLMLFAFFGPIGHVPHGVVSFLIGLCSGAAMIPYTMVREVNPARLSGSATGAINFLVFLVSALLSPLVSYVLAHAAESGHGGQRHFDDFRAAFMPLILGTALATVMSLFLPETGRAAKESGVRQ